MATAGSIVIDLLLRTGAFSTDTKRAEKQLQQMAKSAKQAGQVLGTAIVAGGTAAVAALKLTINSMDDMSKAAQKVGASTEEFSKLTYAAGLADVSMETLVSSLGKLTKAQAAALKENSQQARVFDALGISIKNVDGSLRDSTDVLSDFADKFQDLKGSPEAMAAGFAIFGRSFQDLIPLLKDGSAGIREAGDELAIFGGVLRGEAGANAERFNDNLTRLETAARSLALQVADDLLPDLVKLTDNWVKLSKDGATLSETANGIANVFRVVAGTAEFVGGYLKALDAVIQGATMRFIGFGEVAKGIIGLNWDQIKRGMDLAQDGSMLATFGEDDKPAPMKAKAGRARRGGGPMNYTPDYDPTAALRLAMQDSAKPSSGGGGGGRGASRAAREMPDFKQSHADLLALMRVEEDARNAFERMAATLAGPVAAANYQYKEDMAELNELARTGGIATAELTVAQEQLAEQHHANVEAIQARLDPGKALLADLEFELELMKLGNEERATAIQLRGMDAESVAKYGDDIAEANRKIYESMEQTEFVDDMRGAFKGFFEDVLSGNKSIEDSFKDMLSNISSMIANRIAENWVDQLFGEQGTTGTGSVGGWLSSLFGAFAGGKAGGGDVFGGRPILVGEQGPEMFVPRTAGTVLTADQTAGRMGGGTQQVITNNLTVQGRIDRRSEQQIAREIGNRTRMAGARA